MTFYEAFLTYVEYLAKAVAREEPNPWSGIDIAACCV